MLQRHTPPITETLPSTKASAVSRTRLHILLQFGHAGDVLLERHFARVFDEDVVVPLLHVHQLVPSLFLCLRRFRQLRLQLHHFLRQLRNCETSETAAMKHRVFLFLPKSEESSRIDVVAALRSCGSSPSCTWARCMSRALLCCTSSCSISSWFSSSTNLHCSCSCRLTNKYCLNNANVFSFF